MASRESMKRIMKEAARLRRAGHTPREALKIAWETERKRHPTRTHKKKRR